MSVTIRDVSKICGLSVSAVSKALNHYPDVSEETRQRVQRVAQEIGYRPNALARALKTNRTYNLGVILDDEMHDNLLHTYFITILNGFKQEAERQGYDITLINHNIGGRKLSYLDHCRSRNVDGVCLLCVDFYNLEIQQLAQSDMKLVTIDHLFSGKDCILSDNKAGMHDILSYVVEMGHRRIAFLHGTHSSVTDARLSAFYEFIHQHGLEIPPEYVVPSHYHSTGHAFEDTRKLLACRERPTCILMADDYCALGGMDAIQQAGLSIPEDISVAGYDGTALIQKIRPRLTTLRQDGQKVGRMAAVRLLDRIENPDAPAQRPCIVPGELLPGETVKRIG
ncbi:MAG: LacI family DNA-binding transcriptional regulator [Candidatus Limiplasma sp.]|nr:LacI family DNA-binding transcriptional regulator [Candidatus Limiplasma sp.]